MVDHIALARGINVGGKHRLKMPALVAAFVDVGAERVQTLIQSGNIVFDATTRAAPGMIDAASQALEREHGFPVPLVLRSARAWAAALDNPPFVPEEQDHRLVHVAFLTAKPDAKRLARLDADRSPPDRFVVRAREIFIHYPGGSARSKLDVGYFESVLGQRPTQRNWKTVQRITELLAARAA